jgi:enhancing lycopene biosynthesis protein 2
MIAAQKPVAAVCMAPTVIAKALSGTGKNPRLTVGTTEAPSPYDIAAISQGMNSLGANAVYCAVDQVVEDDVLNIVTSPCYMMEASVAEIFTGIEKTMSMLVELAELRKQG